MSEEYRNDVSGPLVMENQLEIWKDIVGYEGLYQVSNLGRIKSLARNILHLVKATGRQYFYSHSERILIPHLHKDNYANVILAKNGKTVTRKVHRLVLETFSLTHEKLEVNHIDANKQNNILLNLEWCTRKENVKHAVDLRLFPHGENHHRCKLTDNQISQIKQIKQKTNLTNIAVARMFGVTRFHITRIIHNKVRKYHVVRES